MKPRSFSLALLIVAVCLVAFTPFLVSHPHHCVALLERLAPKIERAQILAPESRDVIRQLVDRIRDYSFDQRHEPRAHAVIERVSEALKAKDAAQELSSVREGNSGQ